MQISCQGSKKKVAAALATFCCTQYLQKNPLFTFYSALIGKQLPTQMAEYAVADSTTSAAENPF